MINARLNSRTLPAHQAGRGSGHYCELIRVMKGFADPSNLLIPFILCERRDLIYARSRRASDVQEHRGYGISIYDEEDLRPPPIKSTKAGSRARRVKLKKIVLTSKFL